MYSAAPAYAPRTAPQPEAVPVRVVRGGRYGLRRARTVARNVLWGLAAALLLLMIVAVVYSQAQVTRLSGQLEKTRSELTNAQSVYDYLSETLSDITSTTNVQQIAEGRLGLVRADASQITYIKLQEQSVIERSSHGLDRVMENFRTAALSLLNTLDP